MATATAKRTKPKRDVRLIVYRVIAGLVALFFLAISATWLLWPFGIEVLVDVADPEPARWFAGSWGTLMTIMLAAPLIATLRRPRQSVGLVQYVILGYTGITVASIWVFGEFTVDQLLPLVLLVAAYPAPRALLSRPEGGFDRRLMLVAVFGALALVPLVQDSIRMDGANTGTELQEIGVYWHSVWISGLAVLGGLMASMRVAGWRALLTIIGCAFAYLGVASMLVPDHPGSWGYGLGAVAVLAGAALIAYPRFVGIEAHSVGSPV